ncbi:helix-turn-helix domain-containing protein [Nonomuraea sp. NPDC059023]|uniref:helix-turn-helix domain-containing protein n=1 Tax=unclassified Nonomuraea TaxID=2593643 RepID=UPI0036A40116
MSRARTVPHNGPAIRSFRTLRGLTSATLAERVGISVSHLSRVEHERKPVVSVGLAERIANTLSIEVAAILRTPISPGGGSE